MIRRMSPLARLTSRDNRIGLVAQNKSDPAPSSDVAEPENEPFARLATQPEVAPAMPEESNTSAPLTLHSPILPERVRRTSQPAERPEPFKLTEAVADESMSDFDAMNEETDFAPVQELEEAFPTPAFEDEAEFEDEFEDEVEADMVDASADFEEDTFAEIEESSEDYGDVHVARQPEAPKHDWGTPSDTFATSAPEVSAPAPVVERAEPAPVAEEPAPQPKPEPTPAPMAETSTPAAAPARRSSRVKTTFLGFDRSDSHAEDLFANPTQEKASTNAMFPVGWLVIVEGEGRGTSLALHDGVSQIGRGDDQAVQLDFGDNSISRSNHAAIAFDEETRGFYLGYGGKSNIVRLNGKPVLATETMEDGDLIRIGETTLRFIAFCGPEFSWKQD